MTSSLFWNVTQCRLLVIYWCFEPTNRSCLEGSSSQRRRMGTPQKYKTYNIVIKLLMARNGMNLT